MRQALRRTLVRLLPVVQSVGPVLLLSVLLLPVLLLHLRVLMGELVLVLHRERTHVLLRDVRREVRALREVRQELMRLLRGGGRGHHAEVKRLSLRPPCADLLLRRGCDVLYRRRPLERPALVDRQVEGGARTM